MAACTACTCKTPAGTVHLPSCYPVKFAFPSFPTGDGYETSAYTDLAIRYNDVRILPCIRMRGLILIEDHLSVVLTFQGWLFVEIVSRWLSSTRSVRCEQISVLENHHAATAFTILRNPKYAILSKVRSLALFALRM